MSKTEAEKLKEWRERLGLTPQQLADLSGYSVPAIWWNEKGCTPPRTAQHVAGEAKKLSVRKIPKRTWQKFKNCCAGVEAQLRAGKQFNWGD